MPGWLIAWTSEHGVQLGALLGTALVLIIGTTVVVAARRGLLRLLTGVHPRIRLSYGTTLLITRAVSAVLWIVVALVVLNVWGIDAAGLWTSLVSIATLIGVGFLATWTMVSNVTATFFLTIWRPFHLGDDVEILPENLKGRVVDRNMMFTVLREERGTGIQVPNNLFFQKMFRVKENAEQYVFPFPDQNAAPMNVADRRSAG
jgi:small-conductance mechanosensitive channel